MTHPGFFEGTGMPDPGWWEALFPEPAKILVDAGLKAGMEVADLCSGDGWFTLQIAKVAQHVFAIDIDKALLEVARKRLEESGVSNCDYIEGDAYRIATLCPHAVDFILMANAFHGVPDKPRLAKVVCDALKPGGLFAVVNWHAKPREETEVLGEPRGPKTELRIEADVVAQSVEQSGLCHVKTIEVPPYHYAATYQKPLI